MNSCFFGKDEMNVRQKGDSAFFRGAAWLTVSTLILKIIGLIYKIPLSYMLGDEGMGYFNSAYTVYVFFYVIGTAGIPKAISILVAKSKAENENLKDEIFRVAFKFFFLAGLFLLALFFIFGEFIADIIGNEKSIYAMYAISPSILFVSAAGVIRGYLAGQMNFSHIAISELISGVLKLGLGLLFADLGARSGKSLPVIAAYTILGITIGALVSLVYLMVINSRHRGVKARQKVSGAKILTDILKIAVPITLASAVGSIVNIIDLTLVMNGLEREDYSITVANVLYGNYTTLAVPMLSMVSTMITPVTTAMLPLLAAGFSQDEKGEYNRRLSASLAISTFICIPAATYFAFFSKETLGLIFEQGSATLGAPMLILLAPATLLIGPLTVINTALEASGKPSVAFISLALGAVAKVAIAVILLSVSDIGILAAPIGTSASYLISYTVSRAYIGGIKGVKCSLARSVATPAAAAFIAVFATNLCLKTSDFTGSARLYCALSFVIFSLCYLLFTLLISRKTRKLLVKCVKMNKK